MPPRRRLAKIWAADLSRPVFSRPRPASGALELAELTPATVPLLRVAMGAAVDLVDLRVARGCRAFIACADGQVAAYGWLSTGAEWIGELSLEIRPAAGEAYVWNCVTLPDYRYKGYFRALLAYIVTSARVEGLNRLWIGAVDGGAESAVIGIGFAPAVCLQTLTFAGVRWIAVRQPDGVDPSLFAAAGWALGDRRRGFRSHFRRAHQRGH